MAKHPEKFGSETICWEQELKKFFQNNKIEDLSDFDRTQSKTFYIALNGFVGDFATEDFDDFSENDHVFYMVINISEDETMAYLDFLKYAKGSKGRNLIVSEEPFLREHEKYKAAGRSFLMGKGLNLLVYKDLAKPVKMTRDTTDRSVSLYYERFTQADEDPMYSPREEHFAGDYTIDYKVLDKADEKNPETMESLRQLFLKYEKQIGIDLQFQGFAEELAGLPGAYEGPEGAIIIAKKIANANCADTDCADTAVACVALRRIKSSDSKNQIPFGGICEMKRLYVEPAYGGLEIGGELARRIIGEARRKGYKYMRLDTLANMDKAQKLYEGLGFYDIEPYVYNPVLGTRFMELKLSYPVIL